MGRLGFSLFPLRLLLLFFLFFVIKRKIYGRFGKQNLFLRFKYLQHNINFSESSSTRNRGRLSSTVISKSFWHLLCGILCIVDLVQFSLGKYRSRPLLFATCIFGQKLNILLSKNTPLSRTTLTRDRQKTYYPRVVSAMLRYLLYSARFWFEVESVF